MQKIGDVRGSCSRCGWWGTVYEAEPDIDGDGSLGCPQCLSVVEFGAPNKSVQRTALQVRILNAICYGITAGSLLWLLFGNR